ncbi:MAG: UDP-glucose 4-epimerase [Planctomycetota bacterium]|nr:MAG: UDP-glucose 4-epimerase [Planctomycetota bacterium]
MTTYLVTGGAGFIGSHITTRLVEEGHRVRVLDNLCAGSRDNLAHLKDGVEFLLGDVSDPVAVRRAVEGVEVIFHQAALASVPLSVKDPIAVHTACVTGTVTVLDAARQTGVRRVVYAGSSSAYGNDPVMPKRESQLPQVLSPYAAAKLAGELYCESFAAVYPLETVRLRYFNIFGERQDPASPYSAVIPLFVSALLQGRRPTIFGDGSQSRDFVYVGNAVHANLLAAKAPNVSGKVFNVACGQSLSVIDLLRMICERLNVPFDPIFAPPRTGDIKDSWADISATERELGYRPQVSLTDGLQRTIDYYAKLYSTKH